MHLIDQGIDYSLSWEPKPIQKAYKKGFWMQASFSKLILFEFKHIDVYNEKTKEDASASTNRSDYTL